MVNENVITLSGQPFAGTGGTVPTIDWTMYHFPQPIDLSGMPDKYSGGSSFSRWQKKMILWLTVKDKDRVARPAILAALSNTLFDVYSSDVYNAKLLWKTLDQIHNTDSHGLEKYYVSKFLDFKLVDSKSMTEQVHEFEMSDHALKESNMDLPEKFQVIYAGHWSKACPKKKKKKSDVAAQENTMLEDGTIIVPMDNMVIGEAHASVTNDEYVTYKHVLLSTYLSNEWLIDTGANVHICADKTLFVSYQLAHGRTVTMGNASAAQVLGIGNVNLKFAYGRVLSMTRVRHVPDISRNIINGSYLVKYDFELSLKCNIVIITHTSVFFGKGYLSDGLFLINVEHVINGLVNKIIDSSVN
ncbi:uncharacterized protein LOC141718910 [Apium graveolens]|uniref:uncharacterized protein LOC141718910 n=1 Tax=Apium graveolens TaxID=4045 RepID=UPI003D7BBD3E